MTTRPVIPVAAPVFAGNEKAYVADCLDTTWISSLGPYVERFERAFAAFCGTEHAVACANGTAALHLALLGLHIGADDEVIVPTLSFVATAHAVRYCGARPVFVDAHPVTWTLDPAAVEARITPRTRAIVAVHLYGQPADLDALVSIARRHGLVLIEDCSQAHGASWRGRRVGSIGDAAVFSFSGNKIITTGEGGMVVTGSADVAARVRMLRSYGMDPDQRYWFPVVGYNYRLTNVAAAIGLAQLERIDWHLARRAEVAAWYREGLAAVDGVALQGVQPWATHAWWIVTVLFEEAVGVGRDEVARALLERRVDTRPVVFPTHVLPPYREAAAGQAFPVADRLAARGLSLPTFAGLTREDVRYVCDALGEVLRAVPPVGAGPGPIGSRR